MGRVTTCPVPTTYGYILEPKREADKQTGAVKEKYQITPLFDTNNPAHAASLQECINDAYQVGVEAFGEHFWTMVQQGTVRWPFRDGGQLNPNSGQPKFAPGIIYINCSSHSAPDVVSRYYDPNDPQKRPRRITAPAEYYWGMLAKVNITFKEYKRPDGRGIAAYVNGVQLWHEGDRLGNAFDAQSEFDAEGEMPPAEFGHAPPQGAVPGAAPGGTPSAVPGPAQSAAPTAAPQAAPGYAPPGGAPTTVPGANLL